MMNKQAAILALKLLLLSCPLTHASQVVGSKSELDRVCKEIQPGETVILKNGTYTDQRLVFSGKGTEEQPITLGAETPGKVILEGTSSLNIDGEHLIVDGLQFRGAHERGRFGPVIKIKGSVSNPSRHCILRNTAIIDYNPLTPDNRYHWVEVHGYDNIVEYCYFKGQNHSGVTLYIGMVEGKGPRAIIRHNYFAGRPSGGGKNGWETVKIGSGNEMTNARCSITDNLFEECNGEIEIVSIKSSENTIARNTFLRCAGSLTIRSGHRCLIEDNIILGEDAEGTGGIRVTGEGHSIVGNYLSGTKGCVGGAIALQAGTCRRPFSGYWQVRNCLVASNMFVDNPDALIALAALNKDNPTAIAEIEALYAEGRDFDPYRVSIVKNLFVAAKDAPPMVVGRYENENIYWRGNTFVGGEVGLPEHFGIKAASEIPYSWKARMKVQPLKPTEVGPEWMR